jgi:hypothetical protein
VSNSAHKRIIEIGVRARTFGLGSTAAKRVSRHSRGKIGE